MPTIYDFYRIEWDGNSLSCENDVIIGYNASNKTRLEFVNTSSRADVRFTSIEFRTPLSRIGFDLPGDGKIELSLNPLLYGEDSDLALFWEGDDGKTGAAHMRVMIVESEYYHDEETEQQADDNTQEINQLKPRVSALESFLSGGAGAHNSIYRGKNLGSSVTAEQYAAIAAGTFEDMYIGDYWTINDVVYRIAAFDYYYRCGYTDFAKHHIVVVPDTNLCDHVMNDTDTTTGGYVGSRMYTEGLDRAKAAIKAAFSGHVLSKRIYLSNATANGRASAGAWCDSEVDLMCEHMVYGNGVFSPVSDGTTVPNNYRVEKSQLPLFQHEPSRICNRESWWLRDVISASHFALVSYYGNADCSYAGYSYGVRPAFCIGV